MAFKDISSQQATRKADLKTLTVSYILGLCSRELY